MIRHILQKCVPIILAIVYVLTVLLCQNLPIDIVIDTITLLTLGLWTYILFADVDMKRGEHRITGKHLAYESLFLVSLIMVTIAYLLHSFGWALALIIGSVLTFIGGCIIYVYCYKYEDKFVSTELENVHHMIFVLTNLKDKAEGWTAERLEEYATKEFRFYPKNNHLERTLDASCPVDPTGHLRTLAEMNEADPNSHEAIIARKRIKEIVADYITRRDEREQKKAQKRARKEAK